MRLSHSSAVLTHADVDAGRGHVAAIVEVILDGAPRVQLFRRHGRARLRFRGAWPEQAAPPSGRVHRSRVPPPRCVAPSRALRRAAERIDRRHRLCPERWALPVSYPGLEGLERKFR